MSAGVGVSVNNTVSPILMVQMTYQCWCMALMTCSLKSPPWVDRPSSTCTMHEQNKENKTSKKEVQSKGTITARRCCTVWISLNAKTIGSATIPKKKKNAPWAWTCGSHPAACHRRWSPRSPILASRARFRCCGAAIRALHPSCLNTSVFFMDQSDNGTNRWAKVTGTVHTRSVPLALRRQTERKNK